jgi:hypothetical protein
MSTRLIKMKLLTQDMPVKIETDARTLGELKNVPEVKKLSIDWNNTKVINKADKASFELDESILPAIECWLFITPTKTKSGTDLPYKEVKAKIKEYKEKGGDVPFNYTQATTADLNAFWKKVQGSNIKSQSKPAAKKVADVVTNVKAKTIATKENTGLTKEEVQAMIDSQLGKKEVKAESESIKETPKEDTILVKDIADVVTKAELNSEAQYLKNKFYK